MDNNSEKSILATHLCPGEELVHRTKLSLIIFRWPGLLLLLGLFCLLHERPQLGWPLLAASVVAFALKSLEWFTSEWGLTRTRLIAKTGVFTHRLFDIPLSSIESITINHGIFGRFLIYGTIEVAGNGGTKETFCALNRPLAFALISRRLALELSTRSLRA